MNIYWTLIWRRLLKLTNKKAVKDILYRLISERTSLEKANLDGLFKVDTKLIRDKERKETALAQQLFKPMDRLKLFPLVFQNNGKQMRYSLKKAKNKSIGLIVVFHGYSAFQLSGFTKSIDFFDVLRPLDEFGYNQLGSWYLGEKGDNFVERTTIELINHVREKGNHSCWFCSGVSMGGFAAIYFSIKYMSDGAYVGGPQIDLASKIEEYRLKGQDNPYKHLINDSLDNIPDLLEIAENAKTLPPLFIIQNLHDSVNPFAKHAQRLIDVYNRRSAWYGLRVYPAIGHNIDYSEREAEFFFKQISDNKPPATFAV